MTLVAHRMCAWRTLSRAVTSFVDEDLSEERVTLDGYVMFVSIPRPVGVAVDPVDNSLASHHLAVGEVTRAE